MTFSFGLLSCLLICTVAASFKTAPFDVDELFFLNHANITHAAPLQVTADQLSHVLNLGSGITLVELQSKGMTTRDNIANGRGEKLVLKRVHQQGSTRFIDMEKFALESVDHPFIIQLRASLKDKTDFLFLMEQGCSPDLFGILVEQLPFNNEMARFYVASIMLALEHLHSRGIIHRDVKLENIVLGTDGFPRLIDFDAAKLISDKSIDIDGTERYLSPEMISMLPHGTGVDWWALGHAMYEMLVGTHVFEKGSDVRTAVLEIPDTVDKDAADLIRKLLEKDPSKRLGVVDDSWKIITEHPWFAGFDWIKLLKRDVKVPINVKFLSSGVCEAIVSS